MLHLKIENDAMMYGAARKLQRIVDDAIRARLDVDSQLEYVVREIPKVFGANWKAYRGGHHVAVHVAGEGRDALRQALIEGRPAFTRGEERRQARISLLERQITDQVAWMRSCGVDLAGYVGNYGDPGLEHCYGNGGTAIYNTDAGELARLEGELQQLLG